MNPETEELLGGLLNFVSLAEKERRLIAAELHDQLLFDLRELALIVRRLQKASAVPGISESFREGLEKILKGLDEAADEARRVMEHLRPSVLDSFGLFPAMEAFLRRAVETSESFITPRMQVLVKEEDQWLTEEEQLSLYRIVQEAITNICKHAKAANIHLKVFMRGNNLMVQVADDGIGLSGLPDKIAGRGMENIRFRAQLIGAVVEWRPNEPQGTLLEITVQKRGVDHEHSDR